MLSTTNSISYSCPKSAGPSHSQQPKTVTYAGASRHEHQCLVGHRGLSGPPRKLSSSRTRKSAVSGMAITGSAHEEKVTFTNPACEKLSGILLDTGSSETAILCHGYTDHKNGFHLPAIARALADRDWSSLRFDFSGNGESEGRFRYGNYNEEAEDIRSAVEMLQNKGKTVMGLLDAQSTRRKRKSGHSKGADSVVTYAAKYDDVPRLVNVSGRFDMHTGITGRFGEDIFDRLKKEKSIQAHDVTASNGPDGWTLTEEDMNARLSHDMAKICQAIKKSSVLTIHGGADQTIPFADAHEFAKNIEHHQLNVIEGASHNYHVPIHSKQMIQSAVGFMTST